MPPLLKISRVCLVVPEGIEPSSPHLQSGANPFQLKNHVPPRETASSEWGQALTTIQALSSITGAFTVALASVDYAPARVPTSTWLDSNQRHRAPKARTLTKLSYK